MSTEGAKKLGELLRRAREEKELTLKEVENATSIRISCLQAIEEGRVSQLISPVYAQGFVKQYALFLGLNGDQLLEEYKGSLGKTEQQEFAYGIGTLESRGHPAASSRWVSPLLYLLVVAAMGAIGWYFARFMGLV